jgi:hypothetical protein
MIAVVSSCSKDKDEPAEQPYTVEYVITGAQNSLIAVQYTDAAGNLVPGNIANQSAEWRQAIAVSGRPFTARMQVTTSNPRPAVLQYTLAIFVDGVHKKSFPGFAPPNTVGSVGFIEFIVE